MTHELLLVAAVAAGTLAMRASMVTLLAGTAIPASVEQALGLVAPAVLAGLVAQTLFLDGGELRPFGSWYLAAVVAGLVAWRTRTFGWTLLAGMVSVWLLEALA
ncbi:MAG: AzlD domain-containing protein [Candidatus Limnocylindrales bacterium]|jgi:branched-subunit amino acid transport protein